MIGKEKQNESWYINAGMQVYPIIKALSASPYMQTIVYTATYQWY